MTPVPTPTVLAVTRSDDTGAGAVLAALEERGARAFRLDTDRFPAEVQLVVDLGGHAPRWRLSSADGGELDLAEVTAVWYRRMNAGGRISPEIEPELRRVSQRESATTLRGMITSLRCFHLDPIHHVRLAENKQLQLELAVELGLEVPRTLITNDPAAVRALAAACSRGLITKMLSSFAIYEDGQEKVVFTSPVAPGDLVDLDQLRHCPMTFQEQIPKAVELRAIAVGSRVFTASVDSQAAEITSVDWRRDGVGLLHRWQRYELPADIESRLLGLLDRLGLQYGAFDLIVTPDGRHVFLEVNPAGEFAWLDRYAGLPISRAIAEVLTGEHRRGASSR